MKQNPNPTLRLLSITALSCAMLAPPSVHAIEGLLGYWRFDEGSGDVAIDGSGNGNDGEIISPDDAWVTDADRGSVYQSGNGSYVDMGDFRLPALDLDSDFTWSFWVFPNETDNNNIVFGNRWGPDGVDFAPREFIKFTPRVFEWHFDGAPQNTGGAETMFVVDEWSHNLVVKRGADFVYYRNGEELIAAEITAGPVNEQPLYIGGQNGNEVFSGLFDEVAIFGRALSVAEVTEVYTTGLSGESLAQAPVIEIDFNSDPEGTFEVFGSGSAEWRDSGGVDDSGYFSVTDSREGIRNTIIFDDPSGGLALRGFDFTIDLRVGGGTPDPADGFSLNLVRPEDPLLQDPRGNGFAGTMDIGGTENDLPEEGSQTGLGIGLDAWVSGGSDIIGFSIRVDGVLIKQVATPTKNGEPDDETSLQTGPQNPDVVADGEDDYVESSAELLTWQPFRAFLDPETSELTIQWKGKTLLDKEVVPFPPGSVQPVFAARTGGAWQNHHIDNFRLELFPARLAGVSGRINGKDLVIQAINGPESSFDPSQTVMSVDGVEVTVKPVVDGDNTVYTYTPNPPFEPSTTHPWTFTGSDSLGNPFNLEGVFDIPPTNIFAGGFFTTRHVWLDGDTASLETSEQAFAGELSLQGDITVRHPYSHFHDNAGAPIDGTLSIPYPLWAEPEDIADENIIAGERIGGGLGDRNQFAIESTGEFFLREGGKIIFVVNSDDGFTLWIDGESIGEAGDRGRGNTVMPVDLEPGTHNMRLVQWENGGGAGTSLYVSRAPDLADDVSVSKENFEILSGFNIHDVNTEDTDGDGMDDFKENFFFGDLTKDGTGDEDGDSLTDALELANRADPTVKDSDGDGLEDGREVNELGTSPASVDSDGDSLGDGAEVASGTDPAKVDTDGDTFDDNVEKALGTNGADANSKPDAIIAVAAGVWDQGPTWSNGAAPTGGSGYVGVGTVSGKLTSAAGDFGGDSLTLVGPEFTLNLDHEGTANANITANSTAINVGASNTLEGQLALGGVSSISVGDEDFTLASTLTGASILTVRGGNADSFSGVTELTGEGSNHASLLTIVGTDVVGLAAGSLGTGSITLENGGVAFGYEYNNPTALIKIQGAEFRMVFVADVTVADVIGIDPEGNQLFSLFELLGGAGPYAASDILAAFGLDEGVSGNGTLTLMGNTGDTDIDGLQDAWETTNFGDLNAGPADDPDGDGLINLAEEAGETDPNVSDGPAPVDPGPVAPGPVGPVIGDRPGVISDVVKAGGGAISFGFPAGTTFNVEYSTDLTTWTEIAAGVTGAYEDADAGRNGGAGGYYRGVEQP